MKKTITSFGLILALAACAADAPPPVTPMNLTLPPKISLDVQTIALADRSGTQPSSSPYNSNRFSPTISDAIKQWASDRLQAAGAQGQAVIIIKEASLSAQPLPTQSGIDSWFKRQQSVKYIGHADVTIEANGRPGFATAEASATRAVTLPENPTPTEKQDAYYSLLNGLMKDLGQNLDGAISEHMNLFIVTTPALGSHAVPMAAMPGGPGTLSATTGDTLPPAPPMPEAAQPMRNAPAAVIPLSGQQ